jgi:hypothetical protein
MMTSPQTFERGATSTAFFAVLNSRLRQLFPTCDAAPFANLLMEIDEAEWQAKISKITLRWDASC